jgi:hypothetical protein
MVLDVQELFGLFGRTGREGNTGLEMLPDRRNTITGTSLIVDVGWHPHGVIPHEP